MRALVFALALLGACTSAPPPSTPAPPPPQSESSLDYLSGTLWRRVDDENANPHGATMAFEGSRVSGSTGCNRWFSAVTQDGNEMRFGRIGMTRMACADVQNATERNFVAVIEATRDIHYDQNELVLLNAEQEVIARFERDYSEH